MTTIDADQCGVPGLEQATDVVLTNDEAYDIFGNPVNRIDYMTKSIHDLADVTGVTTYEDLAQKFSSDAALSDNACVIQDDAHMFTQIRTPLDGLDQEGVIDAITDAGRASVIASDLLNPSLQAFVATSGEVGTDGVLLYFGTSIPKAAGSEMPKVIQYFEPILSLLHDDYMDDMDSHERMLAVIMLMSTVYRLQRDAGVIFQTISAENVGVAPTGNSHWYQLDALNDAQTVSLRIPIDGREYRVIPSSNTFSLDRNLPYVPKDQTYYDDLETYHSKNRKSNAGSLPQSFEGKVIYATLDSFVAMSEFTDARFVVSTNLRYPKKSAINEGDFVRAPPQPTANHIYIPARLWDFVEILRLFSVGWKTTYPDYFDTFLDETWFAVWEAIPKTEVKDVGASYPFSDREETVYKVEKADVTVDDLRTILDKTVRAYHETTALKNAKT